MDTRDQEVRIARYRARMMTPAERETFERDVRQDETLRAALAAAEASGPPVERRRGRVIDVTRAIEIAREFREEPGSFVHAMTPIAIAIVIGLAAWWWTPSHDAQTLDEVKAPSASMHLEPRGELSALPTRFVWTRDPAATRYRVEIYDADGHPLGVHVTTDTSLAFAAVTQKPHDTAAWRAVPIDAAGRDRSAADFARYHVNGR
jgi:hypothetical protein